MLISKPRIHGPESAPSPVRLAAFSAVSRVDSSGSASTSWIIVRLLDGTNGAAAALRTRTARVDTRVNIMMVLVAEVAR